MTDDLALRYPIGHFAPKPDYSVSDIAEHIQSIRMLPEKVEQLAEGLPSELWDAPYRFDGWTARQVVHHLADSHLHAYIRTKWALTEETPTIKAYEEKAWAETPETTLDPFISIGFLKNLHVKWTALLQSLSPEQLERTFFHPETKKHVSIKHITGLYAWHGMHHYHHLKLVQSQKAK